MIVKRVNAVFGILCQRLPIPRLDQGLKQREIASQAEDSGALGGPHETAGLRYTLSDAHGKTFLKCNQVTNRVPRKAGPRPDIHRHEYRVSVGVVRNDKIFEWLIFQRE